MNNILVKRLLKCIKRKNPITCSWQETHFKYDIGRLKVKG